MYPSKESNTVGVILRDPTGQLGKELKQAIADRKIVLLTSSKGESKVVSRPSTAPKTR